MAAKVQLMKLKMKAQGQKSIPTEDRIYFGIKSQKKEMKPVFVSKKWSLGKVVDSSANLIGLENKNNVANAAKLKLFKNIDGTLVSEELDVLIEDLIAQDVIFNGDLLIFEYIDDCNTTEIDPSKYK